MKKVFFTVAALTGVISIGILFMISRLPSRSEIVQSLKGDKTEVLEKVTASKATTAPIAAQKKNGKPTDEPTKSETLTPEEKEKQLRQLIAITEEDPRDIRVCDQLGHSQVDLKKPSFTFDELFSEDRSDSIKEAFRMPLRTIFQEPAISDLLKDLQDMEPILIGKAEAEKEGFLSKVGFYARLAKASATLYANKKRYERLGDRAVHLSMLAKLAILKPETQNSSRLMDYCRNVQSSDLDPDPETIEEERKQLLEIIKESGMTPAELDFDPKSWINFSIKSDNNQLTMSLTDTKEPTPAAR